MSKQFFDELERYVTDTYADDMSRKMVLTNLKNAKEWLLKCKCVGAAVEEELKEVDLVVEPVHHYEMISLTEKGKEVLAAYEAGELELEEDNDDEEDYNEQLNLNDEYDDLQYDEEDFVG